MVLIGLRIKGADLPLPERIVECRVDLVRCDIQARSGGPVDHKIHADAVVLLIRDDIPDLRQLAKCSYHLRGPHVQL